MPYDSEKRALITLEDAAELTGNTKRTVQRWVQKKKVTALKEPKSGRVLIDRDSIPGILSIAEDGDEHSEQDRKEFVQETTEISQDPQAYSIRQLGLFTDSAHKHIDRILEKLLTRDDQFLGMILKTCKDTMKENRRLHKELRKARKTEEQALDKEVERTIVLEDHVRKRQMRQQIMTLLVALGMNQIGDEKMQALTKGLGQILSGEPLKAGPLARQQSDPQTDQPASQANTETAEAEAGPASG